MLTGPGESTETAFRREIRGHWFAWLAAQEEGEAPLAKQKTDEIVRYAQKIGIRRLTDLALSATVLGRRESVAGKFDLAREAYGAAVRLDPDLPEARWGRLSLAFATRSFGEAPGCFVDAVRATFVDIEARRVTVSRMWLVGVLAAAAAGGALVLLLIVAYSRLYLHDLSELAGLVASAGPARRLATGLLVVAPLLLSLDVLWLGLVLFVAVWGYATLSQKIASWLGLLTLVAVLPVMDRVAYDLATDASPILRGAEALRESRYDQRVIDNLEGVKNVLPEDVDVRFLLGRLYQALGQNDRAVTEYTTGSQLSPGESRCLVNRGNIHFVDGDYGSAQEDFQEALKRDARNVAARYNLALVYAETFRTVEAAEMLAQARALDGRLVQKWQENPTVVKVVSLDFTPEEAHLKMERLESDSRSHRLLGHYRGYRPGAAFGTPLLLGVLAALALAIGVDRLRLKGHGYSAECTKCGRTFCALCKPAGESGVLCSQCVHVYLKKDGVAIETKLQKVAEVKRRRSLEEKARVVANVLFPGGAAFLDSRLAAAIPTLLVFFVGVFGAFCREELGVVPRPTVMPAVAWTIPFVAVAVGAWVFGQVSSRKPVGE